MIGTRDALQVAVSALDPAHGLRIGGDRMAAADGATFAVVDPTSTDVVAHVADGDTEQARAAVRAAERALPCWAATAPVRRADILHGAHDVMLERADYLAALICLENGKAMSDAVAEVHYAAGFFRWYGEEAVRAGGDYGPAPSGAARTLVTHRPVGVAALVTPWNFPLAMAARKLAPALAAGCTTVLKPARETPLSALAMGDVLDLAGMPAGAVNIVPTSRSGDVVSTWLGSRPVRKVSFTGSTEVGRVLMRQAADRVVNSSMELGGNAPFIVTADADVTAAVAGAMVAKFRNAGQACTAANRFYVHESVATRFVAAFGAAVEALRVGDPFAAGTEIGPLVSEQALRGVRGLVDEAVAAGATIAARARLDPALVGWFYPPTLLTAVAPTARILREEIFGPVAPIVTWSDEKDVLRWANDSEHGLAAYLYAGDLGQGLRMAESLEAGMVAVNRGMLSDPSAPFGGVKQSGVGREGAREGLREYQETRYISLAWSDAT